MFQRHLLLASEDNLRVVHPLEGDPLVEDKTATIILVLLVVGEVIRARHPVNISPRGGAAMVTRVNSLTRPVAAVVAQETTAAVVEAVALETTTVVVAAVAMGIDQDLVPGQALFLAADLVQAILTIHSVHVDRCKRLAQGSTS